MRSSNVIGIPESSEAFEDRCAVLFRLLINDPGLKGVAASGADQGGIDLIGLRDGDPHRRVSVQCKLKRRQDRLAVAEARSDILRSLRIKPPLSEIYVVTTAPDELALDNLAVEVMQEEAAGGRAVQVHIWGWPELQRRIRQFPEAVRAFDPEYSASTNELLEFGRESVELGRDNTAGIAAVRADQKLMVAEFQRVVAVMQSTDGGSGAAVDQAFDQQIDALRDLMNRGRPDTAAQMLVDLELRLPVTASPAVRSRIRANLGVARMRQGRDAEAAVCLREAHGLNPDDRRTRANLTLAFMLEGRFDDAVETCRGLLAEDPDDALAAAYAYQAAAMHELDVDPDDFVRSALRSDENVAVNRLNMLRRRGNPAWRTAASELLEAHPASGVAQRFAAEAMLEDAFATRSYDLTPGQAGDRRARVERAAELLQSHWDEVRLYENSDQDVWAGVGVNLVTTYRSLRRRVDARRVSDQVLAVAPALPDALIAAAHLDVIEDAPARALERLADLPESASRTMVMFAALVEAEDWQGALTFATVERRSNVRGEDVRFFDTLRARARIESGEAEPAAILDELTYAWADDATVLAGAAQIARRHAPAYARDLVLRIVSGFSDETPQSARMMTAEVATQLNLEQAVISALDGFVDTGSMSDQLAWLAWAFANAPVTPRTRAFFEKLPPAVQAVPRIARMAGASANARGDIEAAERHLAQALDADPDDLRARLLLHAVHLRADRSDAANEVARSVDETKARGSPEDRMRLALILARAGEPMRAFELGFAVASANRADEQVVQMYPGLFFPADRIPTEVRIGGRAMVGDWFELEAVDGGRDVTGLLWHESTPEVVIYPPDQSLARRVLGLEAGDELTVPQGIGDARTYRVKEVKHRFVWLLHDIMHTHSSRFPQSRSMGAMTMRDGDVRPVLDIARRHQRHGVEIGRTYQELSLPLDLLAAVNNIGVLQLAELIPQLGGEIRTCLGGDDERRAAERACSRARGRGAVLDTLTAWCAHHLGLLAPMRELFGVLTLSQSTMDELLEMRAKEQFHVGHEYMTIGYEGDQAVRQVHTPDETRRRIDVISEVITSLREHCELLPVDGDDDPEIARLVHREIIETVLDPLRLARQTERLLLSDDLHLRQMAASQGLRDGAWLQVAARSLLAHGKIDAEAYAICVARLASLRHGHVSLDGDVLLQMLRHEQGHFLIEAAAEYIGGPRAEISSHVHVVADFMNRAWSSGVPSWRAGGAAGILIGRLIAKRKDWWETLELLLRTIRQVGSAGGRWDISQSYLRDWVRGHFLSKPEKQRTRRRNRKRGRR